jgi:hypothetical protein
VARCTKIINPGTDEAKYVINVKQIAKFVVGLGDKVAPTGAGTGARMGGRAACMRPGGMSMGARACGCGPRPASHQTQPTDCRRCRRCRH